ncbi:tyrosine-type recombinase/integrase, partial [Escherichia coli]
LNRLIRCVCGKKIGPDPRNFNQRVSLGRNDLLIRTFPIFISRRGSRLSRQQAYRIIRDAGIEAGTVTQTHPHMLRHACGYELAERGADTRLIQDYLGHRNIRHTVRYTASNAARFAGLWERNNLINEKLKREEV